MASKDFLLKDLGENPQDLYYKKIYLRKKGIEFNPENVKAARREAKKKSKPKNKGLKQSDGISLKGMLNKFFRKKERKRKEIKRRARKLKKKVYGIPQTKKKKIIKKRLDRLNKKIGKADKVFMESPPKFLRF